MTAEQSEKMAWLKRAQYAEKRLRAMECQKKRAEECAKIISENYNCDLKQKLHEKNDKEYFLAKTKELYEKAVLEYNSICCEIQSAISNLHDYELETVFTYRYLGYMSIAEIADEMHYAEVTIQRKHLQGLKKMIANDIV